MYFTGRILLIKYYNFLWRSFPRDHVISFDRLSKVVPLKEDTTDSIISKSSEEGNQLILDISISIIDRDEDLQSFYFVVDKIIDNPKLAKIMKVFQNGT